MKLMNVTSFDDGPAVLRKAMCDDGYLYLPGLLPRERILALRRVALQVLARNGWIVADGDRAVPEGSVNRIGSPAFYACLQDLMSQEAIHRLAHEPRVLAVVEALLGREAFPHPRKMVRLSYPYALNPRDLIPAHQDVRYVKGEPDTFTVWVPFGDYPPGRGGLLVAEGSHRRGLFPVEAGSEGRFNCTAAHVDPGAEEWRTGNFAMGDVLVMHSTTLHASSQNHSEEMRLSIDCRFSARDGFINSDQLLPPYHPHVEGWDRLTQGWSDPALVQVPPTVQVEEPETPIELVVARPSVLAGAALG